MTADVFIVCPAHTTSGGPELCHQLADTLNHDQPGRASIVYWPFTGRAIIPALPYRGYDARPALREEIPPGSIVVVPETYGRLIEEFADCRVFYWWMSVNNFYREAGPDGARLLALIRRQVAANLYQSEYARLFCASAGLVNTHRLSDRLSPIYLDAINHPSTKPRRNIIAYNPLKGLARTASVLRTLSMGLKTAPDVIAIQDMAPDDIRVVLSSVKVYVDFGEHPGKDRLPREAAAMGACVLTNRRGSAGNPVDMPIPEEFKINDHKRGFERRAAAKIHLLLDEFDIQSPRFGPYRRMIAGEPAQFAADARAVFPVKVSL